MTKEITLDKFRYWLVISYLFEDGPNRDNYFKKTVDDQTLNRYIGKDCCGFTSVAMVESKESYELYVVPEEFLEKKNIVLAFVKLNGEMTHKYISGTSERYLNGLRENIFLNIKSSGIFGTDIENLLDSSPILLYIEPIEDDLFLSTYPSDIEIETIIKMLGAHENYWSVVFNHILASSKYFGAPWERLIVINTKKIGDRDSKDINVTYFFLDILKQVTLFHLLNHRKKQLNNGAVSKFEIQNLILGKSLKQISGLHSNLLSALGQFYDYQILLTNELPRSKELNSDFLKRYGKLIDTERRKESNDIRPPSILGSLFFGAVTKSLYEIEQYLSILSSKAETISSYSRDKLNTEISIINLNLTKKLTVLTYVIVVLTIILVLDSDSGKTLINSSINLTR